ncbi:MAG: hypothetical protein MRJ68_09315 [Nitrospira sp.]|nr:hypothetical protein [Nitrospira sp.]
MELSRHQKEVLEAMGVALLMLQSAEKVIKLCTTLVLQKSSPLTLDLLQQQEESERTKTLGYFLSELRKRATVHESFDSLLTDFLKNRNDFIHDLSRVQNWDLDVGESSIEAKRFVFSLIKQTETVLKVFLGLVLAWQEQAGMSEPPCPDHQWFTEIESKYKPLVNDLFNEKDT